MSPLVPARRRTLVLNLVLAAALVAAVTFAYTYGGTSTSNAATTTRTGTVAKGTVIATVSASGTLVSPDDLGLDFVTSGTLREVYVKVGDHVKAGETLAKVDDTAATESVTSARSTLVDAVASRTALLQGQTAAQKVSAADQLKQSATQVTTAQTGVTTTEQNNTLDASDQRAAVTKAQAAVTTAKTALAAAASKDVASDTTSVTQASAALTTAQQQQAAAALKDAQSLAQAHEQVTTAQLSYDSTVAQQAVTDSPPTATQLAQVNSAVAAAKIQLASAQRALEGTTLKSAATGTVLSISTMVGSAVAASSSSTTTAPGTAIPDAAVAGHTASVSSGDTGFIVLTGITGLQVSASFSEDDASLLRIGQGATVTLTALPGAPIGATIASISTAGTASGGVVSYTVALNLSSPPDSLKPGQSGTVEVITQQADGVLYVPTAAVTTAGGVSTVTVVNGSTRTPTTVGVGLLGDTSTQITSGLTEGETILATGPAAKTTSATSTTTGTLTGSTGGGGTAGAGGP